MYFTNKQDNFRMERLQVFLALTLLCFSHVVDVQCQTVVVSDVTVAYLEEARLTCSLADYTGSDPVSITVGKTSGVTTPSVFEQDGLTAIRRILSANYSDSGEFTCMVVIAAAGGDFTLTQTFQFTVQERFVFLSQPEGSLVTPLGSTHRFLCHPNLGTISHWLKNGEVVGLDSRVTLFNLGLTIADVSYSDIGQYTCVVLYAGGTREASANLSIAEYKAPSGPFGFGLVISSETPVVSCDLDGVPGPTSFYWQRGEALNASRVIATSNITLGVFVDNQGRLDLTKATPSDSGIYRCTGTDPTGASASRLFNIDIVIIITGVSGTEWYFIIVYVLAVLMLGAVIALLCWALYRTREHWLKRAPKRVQVRTRVRRHMASKHMGIDDTGAIDDYAKP